MADSLPEIDSDDFTRRFALRASNLMWFLGAGASASAGIPTAGDMVWEFKQLLYVSQRHVALQSISDLSNPAIRAQLQDHIDAVGNLPAAGSPDEYASLFEAVFPAESDRRTYLDAKLTGAKPSYGHLILGALMRAQKARLVWTTNFDPLISDACAKIFDTTGSLTSVALDAPEIARQVIAEGRWPLEVKLHGDFRSRRLRNTPDELRQMDAQLRQLLVETCRRFGLIIVGYSGRDNSIMDALHEAAGQPGAFPAGIFWFHRGEDAPLPRVQALLASAAANGVEAGLVRTENFDESMRDLARLIDGIDTTRLGTLANERHRWSAAPRPTGRRAWPVVRLNALPVTEMPSICRRVVCSIGGTAEVHTAIGNAGVDVLAARTQAGVVAFGADADIRRALACHAITGFDLHSIEVRRLRYDSAERGLLREALTRAIARARGVTAIRRRSTDLLAPIDPSAPEWSELSRLVGKLAGFVPGHAELRWREGIATRLDWADDRLWLLVDPCTAFDGIEDANKAAAADFARERSVRRYNRQLNHLLDFWTSHLAGDTQQLRALGISDGIDAVFRLSQSTAFSRRA